MSTTPKSFIKQTPWPDVAALLHHCGVPDTAIADLTEEDRPDVRATRAMEALAAAGAEARDGFLALVDQIDQLRDEYGRRSLRSVALISCMDAATFDAIENLRAAAIRVLLHDPLSFERALASHYADRFRQGRSYGAYEVDRAKASDLVADPTARRRFEAELQRILQESETVGWVHVDWFERAQDDPTPDGLRTSLQAAIYLEQSPRAEAAFNEEGDLITRARRPVVEGAIVFDPDAWRIEVVAKGGRQVQEKIAAAFSEILLASSEPAAPVRARTLDLQRLAHDRALALTPGDGVIAAEVESLTLLSPGSDMAVTLSTRESVSSDGDLHERAEDAFGTRSPLTGFGWQVVAASIRVTFEAEKPGGRPKKVLVSLNRPNRSNLRDHTARHQFIAETLLSRWGLHDATGA